MDAQIARLFQGERGCGLANLNGGVGFMPNP